MLVASPQSQLADRVNRPKLTAAQQKEKNNGIYSHKFNNIFL